MILFFQRIFTLELIFEKSDNFLKERIIKCVLSRLYSIVVLGGCWWYTSLVLFAVLFWFLTLRYYLCLNWFIYLLFYNKMFTIYFINFLACLFYLPIHTNKILKFHTGLYIRFKMGISHLALIEASMLYHKLALFIS